jgi:hypothetical protein
LSRHGRFGDVLYSIDNTTDLTNAVDLARHSHRGHSATGGSLG